MEASRTPPNRIDEQGRRRVALTRERLVDRRIREATEHGTLDERTGLQAVRDR